MGARTVVEGCMSRRETETSCAEPPRRRLRALSVASKELEYTALLGHRHEVMNAVDKLESTHGGP